jgi:hypothetical protein
MNLGQQIGPLPLGAWVVVVGGGLGIAWYTRRSGASSAPIIVDDTSGVPGVGTGAVGGWVPTAPSGGGTDVVAPTITTNDEWARAAINHLIAQNYPPATADSAIRKYISGVKTSVTEYALLVIALAKFGSPPQPLPPTENEPTPEPTQPTPTTPPPAPSDGTQWFTVPLWRVTGMTIKQIAAQLYGNGGKWDAATQSLYYRNEDIISVQAQSRGWSPYKQADWPILPGTRIRM